MSSNAASTAEPESRRILPTNVTPIHYDLRIEPDFEAFTFAGVVAIDLLISETSSFVTLNVKNLEISATQLQIDGSSLETPVTVQHDAEQERMIVHLGETNLSVGQKVRLTHRFAGKLTQSLTGLYRASWKDADGTTKWLAATQLAPIDARSVFPCFDEPRLKATFTVTLVVNKHSTCLSNTDIATETTLDSDGKVRKVVTFHKSPPMSTYLLAFLVGDLDVYQSDAFRVPVRMYCTPNQNVKQCVYAAELAARTLEFYEREFDIPYPLSKMDMVAVPDFPMRGMENWGLIMYREDSVLLDEDNCSAGNKQAIAENVTHELSHQWFGNLVTMKFWDSLWLNEGFARWMAWYACDHFYPEWKVWDVFLISTLRSALHLDALRSSHPVEIPVTREAQINQIFDSISYDKGCSVLRMTAMRLGEAMFMQGVRLYLKNYMYGSAETNDLWLALNQASGTNVLGLLGTWTRDVGYPVVSVLESAKDGAVTVRQNRFLSTGDVKPEEDTTLYPLVIDVCDEQGAVTSVPCEGREAQLPPTAGTMLKLNAGQTGFYRVHYEPTRLARLIEAARAGRLSAADRLGLISDVGILSQAGYYRTSQFLQLLQSFEHDSEFIVWSEIVSRLKSLNNACIFEDQKLLQALEAFQQGIVSTRARELGWTFVPEDGHVEQQFKALMFAAACTAGDSQAKQAAFDMFAQFSKGNRTAIPPNLRLAVYKTVLRYGGTEEYEFIITHFENSIVGDEREEALLSLGATRDRSLLARTLDYILSGNVKTQEIYYIVLSFRDHKDAVEILWNWLNTNWEILFALGGETAGFGVIIQLIVSAFTKEHHVVMVEDYFKDKQTSEFDMDLSQGLDLIRTKYTWMDRDVEDVTTWLRGNGFFE